MIYLTKSIYIVSLTTFNKDSFGNYNYNLIYTAFKRSDDGKMIPLKKRVPGNVYYHIKGCTPISRYLKDNENIGITTGTKIDKIIYQLSKPKKIEKILVKN